MDTKNDNNMNDENMEDMYISEVEKTFDFEDRIWLYSAKFNL